MNVAHEDFQSHSPGLPARPSASRRRWTLAGLCRLCTPRPWRPPPAHPSLLSAQSPVACTVLKRPFYFMMVDNSHLIKESLLKHKATFESLLELSGRGKRHGRPLLGLASSMGHGFQQIMRGLLSPTPCPSSDASQSPRQAGGPWTGDPRMSLSLFRGL